jgi:hypothetical protein
MGNRTCRRHGPKLVGKIIPDSNTSKKLAGFLYQERSNISQFRPSSISITVGDISLATAKARIE